MAYRKLQRHIAARREAPSAVLAEPHSPLSPDTAVASVDTAQRGLASLPPRQREVMAWTMVGFTPTEIAEELKISREAVRASLMKARKTLRAFIEQDRSS